MKENESFYCTNKKKQAVKMKEKRKWKFRSENAIASNFVDVCISTRAYEINQSKAIFSFAF